MTLVDLPCNRVVELVTDYLEQALEPADRAAFEAHLRICEGCSEHTQQIRTTVGLLGRLPPDGLSPAEQDRLLAAFRGQRLAPTDGVRRPLS